MKRSANKTPYIISLALLFNKNSKIFKYIKRRKYLGIPVTAFVITFSLLTGFTITELLVANDYSCGKGLASIGCGIPTVLIALPLTFIITIEIAIYLFKNLITPKKSLAILSTITTIVLVTIVIVKKTTIVYIFAKEFIHSYIALYLISGALLAVMSMVALMTHVYIFKLLLKFHIMLAIFVATLICVGYISFIPIYTNRMETIVEKDKSQNAINEIPFKYYLPAPSYGQPSSISAHNTKHTNKEQAAYLWLDAYHISLTESFSIKQFAVPDKYNPPFDCTRTTPEKKSEEHQNVECTAIGRSKVGCDVYVSEYYYYCQIDKTLVTIDLLSAKADKNYVIAIFDSLTPADVSSLQRN